MRRAITYGINRERILQLVFLNKGQILSGPYTPSDPGYNPNVSPLPCDPETAKEDLDRCGFNLIELSVGIKNNINKILDTEFIRAVRARGASVTKHITKNLLLDLISIFDSRITYLISGAVIIENVFNWNGLGRLGVNAAKDYDYPTIMALVLLFTCLVLFARICKVTLFYLIDPRKSRQSR